MGSILRKNRAVCSSKRKINYLHSVSSLISRWIHVNISPTYTDSVPYAMLKFNYESLTNHFLKGNRTIVSLIASKTQACLFGWHVLSKLTRFIWVTTASKMIWDGKNLFFCLSDCKKLDVQSLGKSVSEMKPTPNLLAPTQRRTVMSINDSILCTKFVSSSHKRVVVNLCFFYRNFHCVCSNELAYIIQSLLSSLRQTEKLKNIDSVTIPMNIEVFLN